MFQRKGFSLLEIMLALIVVSIGISVVLSFSVSSQKQASSQANGNNYSVVTNDILKHFVDDQIAACNEQDYASDLPAPSCDLSFPFLISTKVSAYDYLCNNQLPSNAQAASFSCYNHKISREEYDSLKKEGVDLLTIMVSLEPPEKSDP